MIDITYFADKVNLQRQSALSETVPYKQSKGRPPSAARDLPVTCRGVLYPWHLDHMDRR
jgi:hypothetical protein